MARQCNHCSQPLGDTDKFCPNCGSSTPIEAPQQPVYQQPEYQQPVYQQPEYQQPVYQQPEYQQPVYQQPEYQQPVYQQPEYQQPYPQQPYQQPSNAPGLQPEKPMKWFKFVIWVQLFLSALVYLGNAIQAFTGGQYQGEADLVYSVFPDMKGADTFMGIACLALAIFAIVVRFQLSGYRKLGPKLYLGHLVAGVLVSIIYTAMSVSAMAGYADTASLWAETLGGAVGNIVVIVCNAIYFNKREHLFVN